MKYRIRMASSGSYYVQQKGRFYWSRCSPFFKMRVSAENFIRANEIAACHDFGRCNCLHPCR